MLGPGCTCHEVHCDNVACRAGEVSVGPIDEDDRLFPAAGPRKHLGLDRPRPFGQPPPEPERDTSSSIRNTFL